MMLRILLLDLDEVLIEQLAYHQSLKQCVAMVGRWCGFKSVRLTDEDIALFEALGVTSEWDSSAMCAAVLLDRAWDVEPGLRLPESADAPDGGFHVLPAPDFQSFFRTSLPHGISGVEARQLTERRLLEGKERLPGQRSALEMILRDAYDTRRSLTNRIIQELNLGPSEFEECYGVPAVLRGQGLLRTMDRPLISEEQAARLVAWSRAPARRAVVFTNRHSRLPDGTRGVPEAEIGLARVGLAGLPFVSMGHLDWLCKERGLEPQSLLKPSPVHALAALRVAAGDSVSEALVATAALELDQRDDSRWHRLDGAHAIVFEDSFRGLQSARGAQQSLDRIGVRLTLDLRGVTTREVKRQALERAGGTVYPDFPSAAQDVLSGVA